MVVQIIIVFHNRWIYYYNLVGEINIYNSDAKGRKTKEFHLYMTPLFKSYWKLKHERNSILMDFRVI
jgi:hypothetical protein